VGGGCSVAQHSALLKLFHLGPSYCVRTFPLSISPLYTLSCWPKKPAIASILFTIFSSPKYYLQLALNQFAKEWTKTVKDLHFGNAARNIFLVFEKEKRFLKIKKRTFNKVRVFQKF
jgi:hypothetical protein